MNFYFVIGQETSPYYNLAMESVLVSKCLDDFIILFLWQNYHTIVLGRNQDPFRECRVETFIEEGGNLARRMSGGGAVYHDMGNLNYSFIGTQKNMEQIIVWDIIISVLKKYGIDAYFNGRNDLEVDGRKISGNASYIKENKQCVHGTLLVNTDIRKMLRYLTPDNDKLIRNCVGSVGARVANLTEFSHEITIERLRKEFIEYTDAKALKMNIPEQQLNQEIKKLSKKEWIYGGSYS